MKNQPTPASVLWLTALTLGLVLLLMPADFRAQGIGINSNGQTPYPGAILDIESNDKGVLLPRTDTLGISNPVEGMIIYDTLGGVFRYYSGQQWLMMLQEGYYNFWWADMDGDGFGFPFNVIYAPSPPEYYVGNNDDCDDTSPSLYPGAAEICDGLDNDCDGQVDEGITAPECYTCMGTNGLVLINDHCLIDDVCYAAGTESPLSPCLVCDPAQNQIAWSNNCSNTQACCNDECIDINGDANNCGGCGVVCDDGNPCTIDYCVNGVCVHEFAPQGTQCPGGLCDGNGECIPECANGCDDGNPCTTDYCVNGVCVHENAPQGTQCPGGLCDGSGECIPECPNGCDDGSPCTTDYCVNGVCVHENAPQGTQCPGGLCDGSGECIPECPNGCDDGNPCTTDYCVNGVCIHENAPQGTQCPNGLCDGNGVCIED
jgi:hypothetical protein